MDETRQEWLAEAFETHRTRLRTIAWRMLGSSTEADDAVQEAWLRLSRDDGGGIDNLGAWLTTVVSRVCLDTLRSRRLHPLAPLGSDDAAAVPDPEPGPERAALISDAVSGAVTLVLETLGPDERVAFILHDMFAVPFPEIATILGTTPAAARQLASRARRRLRGSDLNTPATSDHRRQVVEAFITASRAGDLATLVRLLAPDAVLRCDPGLVAASAANADRGAPRLEPEVHGGDEIVRRLVGSAAAAELVRIDGAPAAAWMPSGTARMAILYEVVADTIVAIEFVGDPRRLRAFRIEPIDTATA